MENIELKIRGDILTIRVNLNEEHGLTRSRRSTMIATTGGNVSLWDKKGHRLEYINVNVFKKRDREEVMNEISARRLF